DLLNRPVEVRFRIDPALFQAIRAEQEKVAAAAKAAGDRPAKPESDDGRGKPGGSPAPKETPSLFDPPKPDVRSPKAAKRRWRTLGDFVTGPCNRVAYASAVSVVEEAGQGP